MFSCFIDNVRVISTFLVVVARSSVKIQSVEALNEIVECNRA